LKRLLAAVLLIAGSLFGQNPNDAQYPDSVLTELQATIQSNEVVTGQMALSAGHNSTALTISLVDATNLIVPSSIQVGNEIILIQSKAANDLTVFSSSLTANDCTNATPIVVTTTTAHALTGRERVTITGVTGNTNCNVTANAIAVLSTTTFSLTGVNGNGAYLAGGAVTATGRGFDGSTPASHVTGALVEPNIVAHHVNQHTAEIRAMQSELGVSLANVAVLNRSNVFTGVQQTFTSSATRAAARILCAALPSAPETGDVACDSGDSNIFKVWNGSAWVSLGGASTHDLLSATHTDTAVGTVVRGDLITGQTATPAWTRLAIGAANRYLSSDGTDVAWGQVAFSQLSGAATLSQLPFGTANQVLGTNAGATAQEHKTLGVGTTGTDFAIAHAANSIVFNLPTASASNRGALSTADWSTFNAKAAGTHASQHTAGGADIVTVDGTDAGAGTTRTAWNPIKISRHDTDCTSLTDGAAGEPCYEEDADTLYVCEPTAGGCDTAAEWRLVSGAGSAIDVQNSDVSISNPASVLDFSAEFTVTESPAGEANIALAGGGIGNTRNYTTLFTSTTSVTVTGTAHGFNHGAIIVQCYDQAVPKAKVEPNTVTIAPATYNVTITFSTAQSGECILAASGGGTADSAYAGLYISTPAATGPFAAGTYVKLAGTYSNLSAGPDDFDEPVDGRLRYIGARTLVFNAYVSVSLSIDAAATVSVRLARNGTTIADSQQDVNMATASVAYPISLHTQVGLATNDYLEVFVDHDSGSAKTVTAELLTMTATPATGVANNEGNPCWQKYTIDETALTDADTSEDETLFTCSQFCKIRGVVVKHSEAFTGGGLTAFTVSVGTASAPTAYTSAFDIFAAASDTGFQDTDLMKSTTMAAAGHSVIAQFTSTTANVADATAGNVDIWVCSETIQ
jgi:hypothetical protein